MTMTGRGWRQERHVELTDLATGQPVTVHTGLTPDPNSDSGGMVAVLAVDDGPTLILGAHGTELQYNLDDLDEELRDRQAGR